MTRPGHDGMPPQGPEFAEFLRRELHAAADQLEPRPDGLERIRARVRSGPAYASKHSAASGGFLAGLVRRWNARAAEADGGRRGGHERQQRDWRYGLLRPALAAACAVFAIGVALAIPPLRGAFVQLGTAVGISTSSPTRGGPEPERNGYPGRLGGRRRRPGRYLGRPEQRAGDRVPAEFAVVHRGQVSHVGQTGDATPSVSPADSASTRPAAPPTRDEQQPGRRQRQRGRHRDRDRHGDRDRERQHARARPAQRLREGQLQRAGRQADRQAAGTPSCPSSSARPSTTAKPR